MPSDAPTDATDIDYRGLLQTEQEQLRAELSELGFNDGRTGLDYDANFADTSQVTAERGEAEALAGKLKDSLEELPERQREVVMLRDIDGLSGQEVCAVLEISEANQRVLLHRGRSALRRALESSMEGT